MNKTKTSIPKEDLTTFDGHCYSCQKLTRHVKNVCSQCGRIKYAPKVIMITKENYASFMNSILKSDATSFWLKDAIRSSLERDPIDASKDAQTLYNIMTARTEKALNL